MLDDRIMRVKVKGDFACFTRPDLKVERMSYPCMTPSAARGILDSILWKPEFQWYIRRILVLNPIRFASIKRNEISSKQSLNPIVIEEKRVQRNSVVLQNVAYIIEASIHLKQPSCKGTLNNYIGMIKGKEGMFPRRVKKGQCWRRPYLGTREFSAEFMELDGTEQPIPETIPIGSMLFDIFYDATGKPEPLFFHDVAIRNGILNCEVPENEKMLGATHIQPSIDRPVSSLTVELPKGIKKRK